MDVLRLAWGIVRRTIRGFPHFFNVFRHLLSRCFAVNSSSAARRFGCFVASLRHCRLRHVPPTQQPFITNWHKLGQPGVRKLKDFCSVYFAQRLGWRILMRKIGSDLEGQKRTALYISKSNLNVSFSLIQLYLLYQFSK